MKNFLFYFIAYAFLIMISATAIAAHPSIIIIPQKVYFNHGNKNEKRSKIITVKNLGTKTAYVLMNVFDMRKAHADQTQKATLQKSFGLLAFPRKMAIKPGQSKRISVTNLLKNIKLERDFELQFRTVKSLKEKNVEVNDEIPVGIKINASIVKYAHVYIVPKKKTATYQAAWNKEKSALIFSNTGTLSIKFFSSQQCYKGKCTRFEGVFLPAGDTREVKLPMQNKGEVAMKVANAMGPMPQYNKVF